MTIQGPRCTRVERSQQGIIDFGKAFVWIG